jgi:2-polyprenyl-3-methyl-5-hydroxy-6-metoxy-1,4-benzoquinol methylase
MKQCKIEHEGIRTQIKKDLKEFYESDKRYGADNSSILIGQYGINSTEIVDPTRFMIMYEGQLAKMVSMVPKNADVLDVGTGDGVLAEILLEKVKTFIGLDISEGRISRCSNTYKRGNFIIADAEELPFKEGSFDCVVASELIEHLIEPERFLLSSFQVLRGGGTLIVSTPSALWYENNLGEVLKDQHLHTFSPRRLKRLLEKTGFTTGEMKGMGFKVRLRLPKPYAMIPRVIYAIIKGKRPRRGFCAPVSVEWNIVSNKFLNKLYSKHKTIYGKIFMFLSLIGDRFPSFASQVIIRVER